MGDAQFSLCDPRSVLVISFPEPVIVDVFQMVSGGGEDTPVSPGMVIFEPCVLGFSCGASLFEGRTHLLSSDNRCITPFQMRRCIFFSFLVVISSYRYLVSLLELDFWLPVCLLHVSFHRLSRPSCFNEGLVVLQCFALKLFRWALLLRSPGICSGSLWVLRSVICTNLVDPASSHMLVSKIKPCMSQ